MNVDPTNNCYEWENNSSTCLHYKKIPLKKYYTCEQPTLLEHCSTYNPEDMKCIACVNTHYLFAFPDDTLKCVALNWHP